MEEGRAMSTVKAGQRRTRSGRSTWEYRLIFAACFPIFLAFEVVDRVMQLPRPATPATRSRKSIFASAKEAADTALPYAFMG
jgi:hypothetical protein